MARAYTLNIAADTRAVKVGIDKGVIEPLDDALELLEDIGRSGDDDLGRLERAAEDAQDQTEKVKREFSELATEIRNTGRKAKTDFGDKVKAAGKEASEGVDEVGREAESTSKEMAASFDGSVESIGDAFQELTANAFAGFGPAGAVAGVAAALGIGAVTAELQKQQEEAEETKQALIDMYKEAISEGRNYLDEVQILGAVTDIYLDTEKMKTFRDEAARVGVDIETYVRAQAGSYDDLKTVIDSANEAEQKRLDEIQVAGARTQANLDSEVVKIDKIRTATETLIGVHEQNADAADMVAAARAESERRQREQINRTRDTSQARYEAEAIALGKLPDRVPVRVELIEPDVDAVTRNIQRRASQTRIRYEAAVFTQNGTQVY